MEDVSAIPCISESVVATAGENECYYPGDSPSPPLPLLLSPADDSDRIALNKCNLNYKTKISLPTKEYRGTIVVEQPHEQMEWEELGEKNRFGYRVRGAACSQHKRLKTRGSNAINYLELLAVTLAVRTFAKDQEYQFC